MPLSTKEIEKIFGKFSYVEGPNGAIIIDPQWVEDNIITIELPFPIKDGITGRYITSIRWNKLVKDQLLVALNTIKDDNITHLIKTFDGSFVPRHIGRNPNKPLSRHSWSLAIDLNAREFYYGSKKIPDKRLLDILFANGFENGCTWKTTKDPMHWEVVRIINNA